MSSLKTLQLAELHLTMAAPPVGATEVLLRRSLLRLAGDTLDLCTDMLKSVENDAQSYQLSITVSATGEQQTNESSTSAKQPGASSPTSPSPAASSRSQYDHSKQSKDPPYNQWNRESPTQPTISKHLFAGIIGENCEECNMPYNANQHYTMKIGGGNVLHSDDKSRIEQFSAAQDWSSLGGAVAQGGTHRR